jgi:hypothetical protein
MKEMGEKFNEYPWEWMGLQRETYSLARVEQYKNLAYLILGK